MFRRILIANRGEIALRVIRTCHALGIETVAVHSEADETALHVAAADRAERIGAPAPGESYLNAARLIDAARRSGAEAVHPGYGFLSESAAFARACIDAGLTFIGPSPAAIDRAGSKIDARRLATGAGIPIVPGCEPADQAPAGLLAAVEQVGYPALLKPSAGGGGKGMRVVHSAGDAPAAIAGSRREALAAFGDGALHVERYLHRPRHVEVQIAGDRRGNAVHLFERDCSIQRRYQKVIEESPAPGLSAELRGSLAAAATTLARAARYDNVGTVEFLVEQTETGTQFYFLEMNTRLQVEHAVTELTSGVDLVRAQIAIAGGSPLPWTQAQLQSHGHAIECRVYAEDTDLDYLPQAGRIARYREPAGPGVRVDAGVAEGSVVPIHYDPLLAKVIVHGEQRDWARARMLDALRRYVVLGIETNLHLLQQVLRHPRFVTADVDTGFLETEREALRQPCGGTPLMAALAAAAACRARGADERVDPGPDAPAVRRSPWSDLSDWRIDPRKEQP